MGGEAPIEAVVDNVLVREKSKDVPKRRAGVGRRGSKLGAKKYVTEVSSKPEVDSPKSAPRELDAVPVPVEETPENPAQKEAEAAVFFLIRKFIPDILEEKIALKKKNNEDFTKEDALQKKLRFVDKMGNGEAGIFLKQVALLQSRELEDPVINAGLEGLMPKINQEAEAGKQKIEAHLEANNLTDEDKKNIMETMQGGNLDALVSNATFKKVNGLEKLIFGKELNTEETEEIINKLDNVSEETKEKFKNLKTLGIGIGGIILLLFLGIIQATASAGTRNR